MIRVHDRCLDLPPVLGTCDRCGQGPLVWNGRSGWQCQYVTPAAKRTPKKPCRFGIALSALLVDPDGDLDRHLAIGAPLGRLTLSTHAMRLIAEGTIPTSWLTREELMALRQDGSIP